jgi:hypothetical protein
VVAMGGELQAVRTEDPCGHFFNPLASCIMRGELGSVTGPTSEDM